MKILFWVGYTPRPWDGSTTTGLGGTEVAVMNIAEGLSRYGIEVVVTGQVNNIYLNGVEWIDIESFTKKYSVLPNHFDFAIGVDYLHFIKYLKDAKQTIQKNLFWVHNTDYYRWYKGGTLENHLDYLNQITSFIAPSGFALNTLIDGKLIPNSTATGKQVLPNGIKLENFTANTRKDPNKFIWSSAVDRGLSNLLNKWPKIKEILPEATLDVYYPEYSNPHKEGGWFNMEGVSDKLIDNMALGVSDMGSVSQIDLHVAMQKASYWMYLTEYEETFCITAAEMMAAGVIPICSNKAALAEVVTDGIIIPANNYETMFNEAIQILGSLNNEIKVKTRNAVKERAKLLSWDMAVSKWYHFLKQTKIHGN
tara:strand:+ start:1930 stop:3027 length:1098 start_codon:yes stop_codon:yes gene_type:complete